MLIGVLVKMESDNVFRFYKDTLCEPATTIALKIKESVLEKKRFQLSSINLACANVSDDKKSVMLCFERYSLNMKNYIGSTLFIKESDFKVEITVFNSGGGITCYDKLYERVYEVLENLGFKPVPCPDNENDIDPSIRDLL